MYGICVVLYILIAVALIVLVLIQHGKGADIGAAFGSGASNTVFGSQGASGFLFKLTGWLAVGFFVFALALGYIVNGQYHQQQAAPVLPNVVTPLKKQVVPLPEDVTIDTVNTVGDVTSTLPLPGEQGKRAAQ